MKTLTSGPSFATSPAAGTISSIDSGTGSRRSPPPTGAPALGRAHSAAGAVSTRRPERAHSPSGSRPTELPAASTPPRRAASAPRASAVPSDAWGAKATGVSDRSTPASTRSSSSIVAPSPTSSSTDVAPAARSSSTRRRSMSGSLRPPAKTRWRVRTSQPLADRAGSTAVRAAADRAGSTAVRAAAGRAGRWVYSGRISMPSRVLLVRSAKSPPRSVRSIRAIQSSTPAGGPPSGGITL